MRKKHLCFAAILFILSACSPPSEEGLLQSHLNDSQTSKVDLAVEPASDQNSKNTVELEKPNAEFMETGVFFDLGSYLYPEGHTWLQAKFVDNLIHVWGNGKTIRFDYINGQIIGTYDDDIIPIGDNHYYSCKQTNESNWETILYDKNLNSISQHGGLQYAAMPSTDGRYLVSVDKTITVIEVSSGESNEIDLEILTGANSAIVASVFDGEKVYYSTTTHPLPGKEGVGYCDLISGTITVLEVYDPPFAGIPEYIADGKAWFWQDGSAFGTDGTYGVLLDTTTDTAVKIDFNDPTCKIIGDQAIVANTGAYNAMGFGPIEGFEIYYGNDYKQSDTIQIATDTAPLYRAGLGGLQLSADMNYICVWGSLEPTDSIVSNHNATGYYGSLFLYRVS